MGASYSGQCHCGAIGFTYSTDLAPGSWSVRECQCSFCRAHGARCTSDSAGSVQFSFPKPDDLVRYRFALRTADFLLCRRCGVYIGSVITTTRGSFGIVNLNTFVAPAGIAGSEAFRYDGESVEGRVSRREENWTPVVGGV